MRTYSLDRYGAYFAPHGLRSFLVRACERNIRPEIDVPEYVTQVRAYGGSWARLASLVSPEPPLAYRIEALDRLGLLDLPDRVTPHPGRAAEAREPRTGLHANA